MSIGEVQKMIHASAGSGVARNFKKGGRHNFHIVLRVFFWKNKFETVGETRKALGGPGACSTGKFWKIYMPQWLF